VTAIHFVVCAQAVEASMLVGQVDQLYAQVASGAAGCRTGTVSWWKG
jgi:hypothetical protein